jgi:hypothetical protein
MQEDLAARRPSRGDRKHHARAETKQQTLTSGVLQVYMVVERQKTTFSLYFLRFPSEKGVQKGCHSVATLCEKWEKCSFDPPSREALHSVAAPSVNVIPTPSDLYEIKIK